MCPYLYFMTLTQGRGHCKVKCLIGFKFSAINRSIFDLGQQIKDWKVNRTIDYFSGTHIHDFHCAPTRKYSVGYYSGNKYILYGPKNSVTYPALAAILLKTACGREKKQTKNDVFMEYVTDAEIYCGLLKKQP